MDKKLGGWRDRWMQCRCSLLLYSVWHVTITLIIRIIHTAAVERDFENDSSAEETNKITLVWFTLFERKKHISQSACTGESSRLFQQGNERASSGSAATCHFSQRPPPPLYPQPYAPVNLYETQHQKCHENTFSLLTITVKQEKLSRAICCWETQRWHSDVGYFFSQSLWVIHPFISSIPRRGF